MKTNKKYLHLILLILWICFIFGQSLLNGNISSQESSFILNIVNNILNFFNVYLDQNILHILIRKLAHFSEYLILALLVYKTHKDFNTRKRICLLAYLIPIIDETIQFFIPLRSGNIMDMFIDSLGITTGFILAYMYKRMTH